MSRIAKDTPWFGRRKRSPIFYAFWYDQEARATKRISLGTKNPDEAKARFAVFLSEGSEIIKPRIGSLTVEQALDQYWREHVVPNCAAAGRQELIIDHLKGFFGNSFLAEIDIPMSRSYAEARREQGVTDSTIRRELGALIAAANHARRWKRIGLNEMPSIELTKERVLSQDEQAQYLTEQQITTLLNSSLGEFKCYYELLYWTGARRASIAELEWSQVLWDQKQILLTKPGRKVTKKRRPIVPILPEMLPALEALKRETKNDRVFQLSGQKLSRRFRQLCEQLGLPYHHLHILRHSRATHLLQKGVSLYSVARLLGDTVATIERVYGHHSAERLAEEIGGSHALA